jgi:hypothetical protein
MTRLEIVALDGDHSAAERAGLHAGETSASPGLPVDPGVDHQIGRRSPAP